MAHQNFSNKTEHTSIPYSALAARAKRHRALTPKGRKQLAIFVCKASQEILRRD